MTYEVIERTEQITGPYMSWIYVLAREAVLIDERGSRMQLTFCGYIILFILPFPMESVPRDYAQDYITASRSANRNGI